MTCARTDEFYDYLKVAVMLADTEEKATHAISVFSLRKEAIRKSNSTKFVQSLKKGQILLSDQLLGDLDPNKFDSFETSLWFLGKWKRSGATHEWYINIETDLIASHPSQPEWIRILPEILYDPYLKHHFVTTRAPDIKTATIDPHNGKLKYGDLPFKVDFTVYFPVVTPDDLQEPGTYWYIDSPDYETLHALYVDRGGRVFNYDVHQKLVDIYHEIDLVTLLDNGEAFFVLLKYEPCLESDSKRQKV